MESDGSDATTSILVTRVSGQKVLSELHQKPREGPSGAAGALAEAGVVVWPLANGGITKISVGDVDAVARHVWRAVDIAGRSYAITTQDHKRLYLHRLLCGYNRWNEQKGKWEANQVDHKNGNGLDNRRENIRSCDHRQNQQNSVGHPTARRSKFKGVAFCQQAKSRPWRALITVDGHLKHLGYYSTEQEAALAYDRAARQSFGDFARTNLEESP